MDSYRVSKVDVPESPIASGARGLWQQQRCGSLHYHEEWWGSVPQNVIVFFWALDEGGAAGMWSRRQHLPSALEVQCCAVLLHQYHMPQWTSPSQHIVNGTLSLDEENQDASINLIGVSSLVCMRETRFHDSSKKVVTFHLVPVQQGLCDCIAVPLLHLWNFMGYPMRCKFSVTQNVVQNVEHSFETYSDFRC